MLPFMNLTKALSDENRVRILLALSAKAELCVCHINDMLELAPSTVSKHLFLLRNALLVKARKDGRWMHYRLNTDSEAPEFVAQALEWTLKAVADDPVIQADRNRLEKILSFPMEAAGTRGSCLAKSRVQSVSLRSEPGIEPS